MKMKELLETFSVAEIVLFLVLIAAAIKCIVEFFDWVGARLKRIFDKEYNNKEQQEAIDNKFKDQDKKIKKLEETQHEILNTLNKLDKNVGTLIESDRDTIKAFLTREHHYYCYTQGWIDDYSLDCCLRRFQHYKDEGGNSFIEEFINELKALPKHPPNNSSVSINEHHYHNSSINTENN